MEQTPFPGTRKTKQLWRTWHCTEDTGKTPKIRQMPRRPATLTLAKNPLTNSLFLEIYDTTQNLSSLRNYAYQDLPYGSVRREDGDGPYPTCLTLLSTHVFPTHFPATLLIHYSSSNPHPSIHPSTYLCVSIFYPSTIPNMFIESQLWGQFTFQPEDTVQLFREIQNYIKMDDRESRFPPKPRRIPTLRLRK